LYSVRIQLGWEVDGATQGGCAGNQARGGAARTRRCRDRRRDRPVDMIQAVAQSFGAELKLINLQEASEIERGVTAFARSRNGGLIVVVSAASLTHRELIITLAARHRLPTVYPYRVFASHGGLITYGPDIASQYRHAAGYVDRIFKGENPASLPVQAP